MNIAFKFLMLISTATLVSCASTMTGTELRTSSPTIKVRVATMNDYSDDKIKMFQYSIMNDTDNWVSFTGAEIESSNKDTRILLADKITSWIEACNLEKKVSNYNTNLILGAVALTGAAIGSTSKSTTTANVSSAIALGSITALGAREFNNSRERAEFQELFPDAHIMKPFTIPPKKVIQRWILMENANYQEFSLILKDQLDAKKIVKISPPEAYVPESGNTEEYKR